MKNKFLYISIAIFALGFTSCKKYFEVDNSDRNTLPKTFSTIEGFRAGLAGTYGTMHEYYSTQFYIYPEVAGNMVDITKVGELNVLTQQQDFVSNPDEELQAVGYIWRRILYTIANANNVIENGPEFLETNPDAKSELDLITAQALFIRALAHFDLCRAYAQPYNFTADASHPGVPVVTSNPNPEDAIGRSTVKEVYTQILADLKESERLFGSTSSNSAYYTSAKSVQALLARVYLYSENWEEAIKYATTVINNSSLAHNADYTAMFTGLTPGVESIFRLNGKIRSKKLGEVYAQPNPTYVPADTLMSLFDNPNDIRLLLFQVNPDNNTKFFTKKWSISVPYTPVEEKYDPMVLRASEMYFIRAEANLAIKNFDRCAKDLKIVIGRALNTNPDEITLDETTEASLKETIIRERAKEFCFEGHNFFDITRMKQPLIRGNTTSSIVKRLNYPSNYFILPVPQSELDANRAMTGNPTVNK